MKLFKTIEDYAGGIGGGTYNNAEISYFRWVNQGSVSGFINSAAIVST